MINSNVVKKEILKGVQLETLQQAKDYLIPSFGPMGSNTYIAKGNKYSKDGHTILSNIGYNRPIEMSVINDLTEITRNTVKIVGDGTTSAIILSAIIFEGMRKLEHKWNVPPVVLMETFKKVVKDITTNIENKAITPTVEDIYKIALISTNGNEDVADMVKQIYEEYGMEVFIDVSISTDENNYIKHYDGMTLETGYADNCLINNSKGTSTINHPKVYAFEDPVDTPEMVNFLDVILWDNIMSVYTKEGQTTGATLVPTVIMIPKISRDMTTRMDDLFSYILDMPEAQRPPLLVITNIYDKEQYADLVMMCGAKFIKKYIDPKMQELDIASGKAPTLQNIHTFAGHCDMVEADVNKSKFINPQLMLNEDGEYSDRFKNHLKALEDELASATENGLTITEIGRLKRRINSLKSNLVEYLVGGISVADRDSIKDLVEDAVLNCRSAARYGFGYGANFEALQTSCSLSSKKEQEETTPTLESNIYLMLAKAYIMLSDTLYETYTMNKEKAADITTESIKCGKPFNIRTGEFDGEVLSSIKSDVAILEGISKIITIMFTCNQFTCTDPATARMYDCDTK